MSKDKGRDALQITLQQQFIATGDTRYRDKLYATLGRLPWIISDQKGYGDGTGLAQSFMTHCLAILRWDPSKCSSYGQYFSHRLRAALGGEMRRKESVVVAPKKSWGLGDRPTTGYIEEDYHIACQPKCGKVRTTNVNDT